MARNNECPECGNFLRAYTKRCGCGWLNSEKNTSSSDHRCQYEVRGRRCPLPSTNSFSPYGNNSWYCREHWRNFSDPLLCEAILIDAEKNYHQIIADNVDWRIKLFPDDFQIKKR